MSLTHSKPEHLTRNPKPQVTAMNLTLKHVVVGSGDGQVVWVQTHGGSLVIGLASPWVHGGVCSISFSPGYETMLLGSTAGAVYQVIPQP